MNPAFDRYVGIDYSGAQTPKSSLKGLRVYMADRLTSPQEVIPPPSPRKYWTRKEVAEWLVERLSEGPPTLVGIDHGFSFPLRYFEKHGLPLDWPFFLDDFQRHWPTDEDIYVDFVRDGASGNGAARSGNPRWRRVTELRTRTAKSVFHFDVQGSVAKSTHAGIPWLRYIRQNAKGYVHFWPFDGWIPPANCSVVAEVYPALWNRTFPRADRTDHQQDAYVTSGFAGIAETDTYNNRLQVTEIQDKFSASPYTTVLDLSYSYAQSGYNNGNITAQTNNATSGRTQTYTYDPLNRLLSAEASATSGADCWGQDFGNNATPPTLGDDTLNNFLVATSTKCSSPAPSWSVNSHNQFTNTGVSYDSNGNNTADGAYTYTYDAENRICSVGGTSCTTGTSYTYDGDSERVKKSSGTLYWYGLSSDPLLETDTSGNLTYAYILFNGRRIARRDSSSNVVYYFSDDLGTSRVVTNASGTAQDDSDFYPYGGQRAVSSASGNTYLFTGKERDSESGLDNFSARYYSSQYGRFMTPDPSNLSADFWLPQTWNRYSYVLNNPSSMVDQNGLWPSWTHDAIIEKAFQAYPGMTKDDLATLEQQSAEIDSHQETFNAYMHGMSDGNDPDTVHAIAEAEQKAAQFISDNEAHARVLQANWIASGHKGFSPDALKAFGNALHTITDMTSPAHKGFQPWYGEYNINRVIQHVFKEFRPPLYAPEYAVVAAQDAFEETFDLLGGYDEFQVLEQQQEQVTSQIGLSPDSGCSQDEDTGYVVCQ